MLNAQCKGTVFVAFVGACVAGLTWISSTLIEVDKNVAMMDLKIDANNEKIDELHAMIRPMWEEFTEAYRWQSREAQ